MNITTERFRGILQRLLEKSRKDEVIWEAVQQEQAATFRVTIMDVHATIIVGCFSPEGAPDWARADLLVDGGEVMELVAEDNGDSDDYRLLKELWQDAHRCVFGWDQALEKLENALQSEGTVGAPF